MSDVKVTIDNMEVNVPEVLRYSKQRTSQELISLRYVI